MATSPDPETTENAPPDEKSADGKVIFHTAKFTEVEAKLRELLESGTFDLQLGRHQLTSDFLLNFFNKDLKLKVSEITFRRVIRKLTRDETLKSAGRQGLQVPEPRLIGLVSAEIDDAFMGPVVKGLLQEARKRKRQVIVEDTQMDADLEFRAIRQLLDSPRVDGIVWIPIRSGSRWREIKELQEAIKKPIVFLERSIDNLRFNLVASDNRIGGYDAAKHLVEQLSLMAQGGALHLIVIGRDETIGQIYRRQGCDDGVRGALDEMRDNPAVFVYDTVWVHPREIGSFWKYKQFINDQLEQPLRRREEWEPVELVDGESPNFFALAKTVRGQSRIGVFCMSDAVAAAFLGVLHDRGFFTPKDVMVMGFDDLFIAGSLGLSTIHQDFEWIGACAVQEIFSGSTGNRILPTGIKKRPTTGCVSED